MSTLPPSHGMTQEKQVNDSVVDPTSLPVKRKRGRPRKDDVPVSELSPRTRQRRRADPPAVSPSQGLVGQPVSGILEGAFDAGYLLTVRVGITGPVLRGVVFDPHLSPPLSAENDIAPHLPMLGRNVFSMADASGRVAHSDATHSLQPHSRPKDSQAIAKAAGCSANPSPSIAPEPIVSEVQNAQSVTSEGPPAAVVKEEEHHPVTIQASGDHTGEGVVAPRGNVDPQQRGGSSGDASRTVNPAKILKGNEAAASGMPGSTSQRSQPQTLCVVKCKPEPEDPRAVASRSEPEMIGKQLPPE